MTATRRIAPTPRRKGRIRSGGALAEEAKLKRSLCESLEPCPRRIGDATGEPIRAALWDSGYDSALFRGAEQGSSLNPDLVRASTKLFATTS
jgi:hypothetical protein